MSGALNGHQPAADAEPLYPIHIPTMGDLLTWREALVDLDIVDDLHLRIVRWTQALVSHGILQLSGMPPRALPPSPVLEAIRDDEDATFEALAKSVVMMWVMTLRAARLDGKLGVFDAACTCPDESHQTAWTIATPIRLMLGTSSTEELMADEAPGSMPMALGMALDALWGTGKIAELAYMQRVWNYSLSMCATVLRAHAQLQALRMVGIDPNTIVGDDDEGGERGGLILP